MNQAQRDLLPGIEEGKIILNTTTGCLNFYQKNTWREFCEVQDKKQETVTFDKTSGKLKYLVEGEWLTFTLMNKDNEVIENQPSDKKPLSEPPNEDDEIENTAATAALNLLPSDCRRKPTRPYAGKDLVGFDMVELEGNTPIHGLGAWQILQGMGGQFVDSTVANTQFYGIQGTTYTLRWRISTSCDTLYDDLLVRIRPPCEPEPSISFAGRDQLNVETANLSANFPNYGKGGWVIVSGLGGKFDDVLNPRAKFTGNPGETYVLRWVIRNECGLTQDDVVIKIKPPCSPNPDQAYAGKDQIDVENCKLYANRPIYGRGKWSVISGTKGRFEISDSSNSRFFGLAGKTYVLRWTISTKCGSTFDDVTVKFSASCPAEFTDFRDGKKYKTIRIAKQCWMAENLSFRSDLLESYCYDDLPSYCEEYGRLYPWTTAMNNESKESARGLCPEGWHVPSDMEWQHLIDSSGFPPSALLVGGESGFNVPIGGSRYTNGKFFNKGEYAYYWSSTSNSKTTAFDRYFQAKGNSADHYATEMRHSFSVRCVKDVE
ncbi:MAG: FISUMP domain-containing protein [Vicingaceae bacterium]